jgi:hypothetical protein
MRSFCLFLLLALSATTACYGAAYELEAKFVEPLYKLHYADALKATGRPWPIELEDHRVHVVPYEDGYWAIIADQMALHTDKRTWSIFVYQDGAWKALPYTVGGVAVDNKSVQANRDRIVLRLHLEKLPTRIVNSLLDAGEFMTIRDPDSPEK